MVSSKVVGPKAIVYAIVFGIPSILHRTVELVENQFHWIGIVRSSVNFLFKTIL